MTYSTDVISCLTGVSGLSWILVGQFLDLIDLYQKHIQHTHVQPLIRTQTPFLYKRVVQYKHISVCAYIHVT